MDLATALLTLLHLLIPIYWLGGDLGVFYAGRLLRNPAFSASDRLMVLKILLNLDMGPRTALILTFPTGFTLAAVKGWLAVSGLWIALAWAVALVWLWLAWNVHLRHGPAGQKARQFDSALRHTVLAGLAVGGIAGLAGMLAMPLFLALKLLALALAIALGLIIRRQLVPLFPAIGALRTQGASDATNAAITGVLERTSRTVLCIWAVVLVASFLGIATPV
jgi:hypothetical protein